MKLSVDPAAFAAALGAAARLSLKVSPVPPITCVRLDVNPGGLDITATDYDAWLEQTIPVTAPAESMGRGICVPAHALQRFVGGLTGAGEVRLEVQGTRAKVSQGNSSATFAALPADDFPLFQGRETGATAKLALPVAVLLDLFKRTVPAASDDEFRQDIAGVHLRLTDGALVASTFDGKMMCRQGIKVTAAALPTVTVPTKTAQMLVQLLPKSGEALAVLDPAWIGFHAGPVTLTSRVQGGAFPNLDIVIPKDLATHAEIDPTGLRLALWRLIGLSTQPKPRVDIAFADGEMVLTSGDKSPLHEGREAVPTTGRGPACKRRVDARLLLNAARCAGGRLGLATADDLSQMSDRLVLTDSGDSGWLSVLATAA